MLDKMPDLDVLSIEDINWPELSGMPNNPSALLVLSLNASTIFPLFFSPICKGLLGISWLNEKIKPPISHYALRKPLSRLSVETWLGMDEPIFPWLIAQAPIFRSITTLMVTTSCLKYRKKDLAFQALLDVADSLPCLKIHLKVSDRNATTSPPTLIRNSALRSLVIYVSTILNVPFLIWVRWLRDLLRTAISSRLFCIGIIVELDVSEVAEVAGSMTDIADCIDGIPSLLLLHIIVGLSSLQRSRPIIQQDCDMAEGLMRVAFRQCDARGILRVYVTRCKVDDFLISAM
jgi:hypothetical protein